MVDDNQFRVEHDLLGDEKVPADAYYGIQTQRAMNNFDITGVPISHFPHLIRSLAMVKKAAALANRELGQLDRKRCHAILAACDEIIAGKLHDQFPVDLIQGGAGTSTNMAANEVIANRGLELMGKKKGMIIFVMRNETVYSTCRVFFASLAAPSNTGEYQFLHPNNDVNMSQSTNDAYPTAVRLAIVFSDDPLIEAVKTMQEALDDKAKEFSTVLKLGRTQLQDAVPMTLGSEFSGWSAALGKDLKQLAEAANLFSEVNLGGTAIGTGINTDPAYTRVAIKKLANVTGVDVSIAPNLIEASSDMGDFIHFSGLLKRLAVKLSKIANDLRLLSSGPRGGFNDINLPPVQPGSSIMPGKVNPVIPECVNQTCFQVIGNDLAITMAAEAGQLQLNFSEPLIVYNMLSNLRMMTNACNMLTERCIRGITANVEHCEKLVYDSIGIVTAFNPFIGYEKSTAVAKKALRTGQSVVDVIKEDKLLGGPEIDNIMKIENLTGPSSLLSQKAVKDVDRCYTHMVFDTAKIFAEEHKDKGYDSA